MDWQVGWLWSQALRGIGKTTALTLVEAGAAVGVNYRVRADEANAVASLIQDHGGRAGVFGCDVLDGALVRAVIQRIEESLGSAGILVNNAGIAALDSGEVTKEDSTAR